MHSLKLNNQKPTEISYKFNGKNWLAYTLHGTYTLPVFVTKYFSLIVNTELLNNTYISKIWNFVLLVNLGEYLSEQSKA